MSVVVAFLHALRVSLRSRGALQAEILGLRHQLHVLERSRPRRLALTPADRLLWVWLSRVWPGWRSASRLVTPATVVAWHRQGLRPFWTWKSRRRSGRPDAPADLRVLIRRMSEANPLWGAPRVHGELVKLGIDVSQATVAKYLSRRRRPPSPTWRTFHANHASQIIAADFFVVPTATYRLLFVLVLLAHERRRLVHVAVTPRPTAAWTAPQLREAFPDQDAPRFLLHDRDNAFAALRDTIDRLGIHDVRTAPRAPWQNGYAERVIGSIRVSVSTTSSCLPRPDSGACSGSTSTITITPGRTWAWRRTRRWRDPSATAPDPLSRCPRSAGSTIATPAAPRSRRDHGRHPRTPDVSIPGGLVVRVTLGHSLRGAHSPLFRVAGTASRPESALCRRRSSFQ
jgi:hypothetical protein